MIATPGKPSRPLPAEVVTRFAAVVGSRYALTNLDETARYTSDDGRTLHGSSPLVLRPGSTKEVSDICKIASEYRIPLVPQGGNTGFIGGQTPFNDEVVVSLLRMDGIRDLDAHSNTMTVEAGLVLQRAQERASAVDRLFPLSLGAEGSCTIGGNLSTNAGGTAAVAYGVARDMALGLEVVLADGSILNLLSKLKKDNTGFDLRNLFIGAEGTLGFITAATLKLFPKPRSIETAFVGLRSPADALTLLSIAQQEAAGTLTSFELFAETCMELCIRHGIDIREPLQERHQWYVLMELSSVREDARSTLEAILEHGFEAGLVDDATIASTGAHRNAFWKLRETITPAQKAAGALTKHDVSVPIAMIPDFIEQANGAVLCVMPGCRIVPFGHLGDGNIHYNVLQPEGLDSQQFKSRAFEINDAVLSVVARMGGSISAEHGIGTLKRDQLLATKDPVAIEIMRGLKLLLDPLGIMNPGKVL